MNGGYIYLLHFLAIALRSPTQKTKWFRQIKLYDSNFGGKDVDVFIAATKRKKDGVWLCAIVKLSTIGHPQDLLMRRVRCKMLLKTNNDQ